LAGEKLLPSVATKASCPIPVIPREEPLDLSGSIGVDITADGSRFKHEKTRTIVRPLAQRPGKKRLQDLINDTEFFFVIFEAIKSV
jgi:hypothetical protein